MALRIILMLTCIGGEAGLYHYIFDATSSRLLSKGFDVVFVNMETSHQYYVGSIEGGITPQKQHDLSVGSLVKCSYCVFLPNLIGSYSIALEQFLYCGIFCDRGCNYWIVVRSSESLWVFSYKYSRLKKD